MGHTLKHLSLATACALALFPSAVPAQTSLRDGAVVRIQSSSIESGWHTGRLHLDERRCWMVKLDKATEQDYTMLALLVVDQLQIGNAGSWTPVGVQPALNASPAECREYGAD